MTIEERIRQKYRAEERATTVLADPLAQFERRVYAALQRGQAVEAALEAAWMKAAHPTTRLALYERARLN